MRVLVVSHNCFCMTENMGKTLYSYFSEFENSEIFQFFIYNSIPEIGLCKNYYRVTDIDILKSIFTRKSGKIFKDENLDFEISEKSYSSLYQKGRRRTPFIYFARNLIWKLGAWKTKKLKKWLDEINPDLVFFASGDYAFMYNVANFIADYKKIPLFVCCMDDYYINNKNKDKFGGKIVHRSFVKQVNKTMNKCSAIFCICDKMASDYSKLFSKKCYVLHTSSTLDKPLEKTYSCDKICYIGNLGFKRYEQLIDIGRELKGFGRVLDVYSGEKRIECIKDLTPGNGISFHGKINYDEVLNVMANSSVLVHVESFDSKIREEVKYSVSTKIADSLASGTCLLAYGPPDIASIEYLKENDCACVITKKEELYERLSAIIGDERLRNHYVKNALVVAENNHNAEKNSKFLQTILNEAMLKGNDKL